MFYLLVACGLFFSEVFAAQESYDVTIIGSVNDADGIGGLPIGFVGALKDKLKMNVIPISRGEKEHRHTIAPSVRKILETPFDNPGRVSILFDNMLWWKGGENYSKVPSSPIKIAYQMFETTLIPRQWAEILNQHFDLVAVPDPFWVQAYQDSGVAIPIFVIPYPMNRLEELVEMKGASEPHRPFVFGSTVGNLERKNLKLLITAFAEEFDISEGVILKINSRCSCPGGISPRDAWFTSIAKNRIFYTESVLDRSKYVSFMRSFDCYVNLAKGEGFSITPREALALEIPCILSNNTAHITLCDTGLVRAVPSEIQELAPQDYQKTFDSSSLGFCYNCSKEDVRKALRDVYENYALYKEKAQLGREWVVRYSWDNIKGQFLNLVKPKRIVMGDRNEVTDEYLMTNSSALYKKYQKALGRKSFFRLGSPKTP